MPLRPGNTYNISGIGRVKITRSTRKGKKKKATRLSDGKTIHFGASGFTIGAGKKKGQGYCARSLGIGKSKGFNANTLARIDWHCSGKTSKKKLPKSVRRI